MEPLPASAAVAAELGQARKAAGAELHVLRWTFGREMPQKWAGDVD